MSVRAWLDASEQLHILDFGESSEANAPILPHKSSKTGKNISICELQYWNGTYNEPVEAIKTELLPYLLAWVNTSIINKWIQNLQFQPSQADANAP